MITFGFTDPKLCFSSYILSSFKMPLRLHSSSGYGYVCWSPPKINKINKNRNLHQFYYYYYYYYLFFIYFFIVNRFNMALTRALWGKCATLSLGWSSGKDLFHDLALVYDQPFTKSDVLFQGVHSGFVQLQYSTTLRSCDTGTFYLIVIFWGGNILFLAHLHMNGMIRAMFDL